MKALNWYGGMDSVVYNVRLLTLRDVAKQAAKKQKRKRRDKRRSKNRAV